MITKFWELGAFFVVLGLTEAYLKPWAVWVVSRPQRILAGKVLDRLDPIFPQLIADCSPEQLTEVVQRELEVVSRLEGSPISERLAEGIVKAVFALYNPLINAEKLRG